MDDSWNKLLSLVKRRGFIYPGSDIYGGLANSWDYGPLGVELKNNIRQEWWRWFVARRRDIVGIEPAIIMNPKVWEASGHIKEFSDPLVECKKCHGRFRADTLEDKCPQCGGKDFTDARQFNLLFKTFLGPVEDDSAAVYLRGELAQAMFVNFALVQESMRMRLPFGIAAQGKAFRNEITPGNFIFRTREFDLMEFEYFVSEAEWEKHFTYWLGQMHLWLEHLGAQGERVYELEVPAEDRAHYSKRTVDIEYDYPFGKKELYGLAYRTDFDLKNHMEKSGEDLRYTDPESGEKILPHVIEPTFGLDRSVLVAMLEAYQEEEAPTAQEGETEKRVVMKFPYWMAPVKVAVFPLVKNKENVVKKAQEVFDALSPHFVAQYDEAGAVGRRYRRQDEIGTPFCVTIDFETLEDDAVTIRDRDSMKQERVKVTELVSYLHEKFYA
jgi:glycyl-tRNA synthetase